MAASPSVDFQREVLDSEKVVLVLFYAQWCPFCMSYLPSFREAHEEGLKMVEVDIGDYENPLWDDYSIDVIPTMILFQDGKVVGRADGVIQRGLGREDLGRMLQASREVQGKG